MQPKPIRALSRGLAVLSALNRHGTATVVTLARETGLSRATVYRIMQTLLDDGYVARGTTEDRFIPRLRVRELAEGFEDEHWISGVAKPALAALTARILWPSDVATLEGTRMVIRDTTHRIAPLSIDHGMVGRRLPMLASTVGHAYLAFAPEPERDALLALLAASNDPADAPARDPARVARLLAATRRRGYGLRQGGRPWPHTGSIGLPIRLNGRVLGCINVIWMARVVRQEEGIRQCLEPLQETAALIEARLAAGEG
ncbi:helix-turn-helix domain-containing protein [Muricoccus aerilatus]|uniref:helix-turn-helix domain-containing protein n=1 Tax=Muricoccus aerilatus TaxID=452982 RepID=UPI0005C1FF9D|nr:helix-turn-helix domain-containing protein [Roseomonas aerilata]